MVGVRVRPVPVEADGRGEEGGLHGLPSGRLGDEDGMVALAGCCRGGYRIGCLAGGRTIRLLLLPFRAGGHGPLLALLFSFVPAAPAALLATRTQPPAGALLGLGTMLPISLLGRRR